MSKLAEQFGKEVRARRKARGMTQAQLGEAADFSEEWLRRIERGAGAPSFDAIEGLAAGLKCTVADLFSTMNDRDAVALRIETMLSGVPEADLAWLEELISVALRHPAN